MSKKSNGNGNGHVTNGNGNGNGHATNGNGNGKKPKPKHDDRDRLRDTIRQQLAKTYIDVRQFGAVLNGDRVEGYDAGKLQGPVQVHISNSVNAPEVQDLTITRVAVANEKLANSQDASRTMGNKWIVAYALFPTAITVNPFWADKSGMTHSDLMRFFDDLLHIFDNDASAARPEMNVRKLIIAKHRSKRGDCPSYVLSDLINIQQKVKSPRSYNDFDINIAPSPTPNVELFVVDPWPLTSISNLLFPTPLADDAEIANRYNVWLIWEAIRSNPNGDPDNGNRPRIDAITHQCLVTDVCLKRKIRNRLAMVHNLPIYIEEDAVLSLKRKDAYDTLGIPPEATAMPDSDDEDEEPQGPLNVAASTADDLES